MKVRTAIIILLILAVVLFGIVFYFIQTKEQTNTKHPVSEQSQPVKQLTPAERRIQASNLMDEIQKNNPVIKPNETPATKEKRRQSASAIMDQIEKNNNLK